MALVSNVTNPVSTLVRAVSATCCLANAAAKFVVLVPVAELNAVRIDTIAENRVLVSIGLGMFLILEEGVLEASALVSAVMIDFSFTVRAVSAVAWDAMEVAKVAVETPVAEVRAVSMEAIATNACLLSHSEGI